jgi:hypothetical protein
MSIPTWQYFFTMLCCILILFFIHEFFRKFLKITSVLFVLVFLSFPWWIKNLDDWFLMAKTLLMVASIIIINFSRLGNTFRNHKFSIFKSALPLWLIYIVLLSNILLALSPDIEKENYFNALAGVILCTIVPLPPKGWRIDSVRYKNNDLLVDLPILWCLLYVSWWMNLVYGSWPGIFNRGICLVIVTLIPIILYRSADLWLSIRAYTLVIYLLSITFFNYSVPYIDTHISPVRKILIGWGVLNSVMCLLFALFWFLRGRKKYIEKYAHTAGK